MSQVLCLSMNPMILLQKAQSHLTVNPHTSQWLSFLSKSARCTTEARATVLCRTIPLGHCPEAIQESYAYALLYLDWGLIIVTADKLNNFFFFSVLQSFLGIERFLCFAACPEPSLKGAMQHFFNTVKTDLWSVDNAAMNMQAKHSAACNREPNSLAKVIIMNLFPS